MKLKIIIIYLFVIQIFSACSATEKSFKKFKALEGVWVRTEGDSKFIEKWVKINKNLYQANSIEILKGDTVFAENVDLKISEGNIYYNVSFPMTKNSDTVSFMMINEKPWTFENKDNDFPQRIIYKPIGKKNLHAWIEGFNNGNLLKIDFKMKRFENQ